MSFIASLAAAGTSLAATGLGALGVSTAAGTLGATAASVLGGAGAGALTGAGLGALGSAVTGQDVGEGAGMGALGGALTGGLTSGLGAMGNAATAAEQGVVGQTSTGALGTAADTTQAVASPVAYQPTAGSANAAFQSASNPALTQTTAPLMSPAGEVGVAAQKGVADVGLLGKAGQAWNSLTPGQQMVGQGALSLGVGSLLPSASSSAEDDLNAANASDREQYLRYLRQYRPSVPPGYAAGGITDLDGYMSNAQNIPNPNEVADPEGYPTSSVRMMAGGGLSSLIPGGQGGADWLAKNSLPGMIFGWEGAHDIPLIGGMFNDPNIANLSPEEKKKLLDMAAAQGQAAPAQAMAQGGIADLGGYRSGGSPNLLHGPGTGVSDDIPATIEGKQPARLASGEYVISSRIVSELGQGSTDAGAKVLDNMVNRINEGRSKTLGGKNYAKDTRAYKHLPV
jgi:hypothetical protein